MRCRVAGAALGGVPCETARRNDPECRRTRDARPPEKEGSGGGEEKRRKKREGARRPSGAPGGVVIRQARLNSRITNSRMTAPMTATITELMKPPPM
ncbi:hypothetical protein DO70_4262 [Burkholderia pseudomallei]|nr:hypothetical protein DO70_4262 [Burkholderia pseudomallei]